MTAISAKRSRWNGYCGSLSKIAEARRIACGPKRVPGRLEVAASKGMPHTTASAPVRSLVKRRRMKESAPAKVGSEAADVRLCAVKAWSMVLFAMGGSFLCGKFVSAFYPRNANLILLVPALTAEVLGGEMVCHLFPCLQAVFV